MTIRILAFLSILSVSSFAIAVASDTRKACSDISKALPGKLFYPNETAYTTENRDYWNVGLADLRPACISLPESPQDVSAIVKILNKYDNAKFAIKSGGHDPAPGFSSSKDGVLVALRHINGTVLDKDKGVAYIKPGGHWKDVITPLEAQGYTVVGGRLGVVGIGGYLVQGGLSFLSAQHGLAADNILEYEIVLADGSIRTITASEHPDIVVALRGGGNQFGIVTKFTLRVYPIGYIWGGIQLYTSASRDALYAGLTNFIENNHKDPKAAVIFTATVTNVTETSSYSIFYFYNATTAPPGTFGGLEDIPSVGGFTGTIPYSTLVTLTDAQFTNWTFKTSFRSITLPHRNNSATYIQLEDSWRDITGDFQTVHPSFSTTLAYQSFPNSIGAASEARGGNSMGLTGRDHTRFVLEIAAIHQDPSITYRDVQRLSKKLTDKLTPLQEESYNPFFMNDAGPDQDVTGSYKGYRRFAKLQRKFDPNGLWQDRTGGFVY